MAAVPPRGRRSGAAHLARRRDLGRACAVPSGLLIAVTSHISTDVAAAPLLWVIPLALYLLTFVIVFQRGRSCPHNWMLAVAAGAVIVGLVIVLVFDRRRLHHC